MIQKRLFNKIVQGVLFNQFFYGNLDESNKQSEKVWNKKRIIVLTIDFQ